MEMKYPIISLKMEAKNIKDRMMCFSVNDKNTDKYKNILKMMLEQHEEAIRILENKCYDNTLCTNNKDICDMACPKKE